MDPAILITMIAAVGSLVALILDKIRKSRCTKIESCFGCFKIERDLDDIQDENENSK